MNVNNYANGPFSGIQTGEVHGGVHLGHPAARRASLATDVEKAASCGDAELLLNEIFVAVTDKLRQAESDSNATLLHSQDLTDILGLFQR
ncbi:hypothetical protein M8C13_07525 [Crossiella sp. SN42]|uniref:hypothetical protein n=1 Tax=Crossiella sp. SN42 TaxID=2944808 RepID=UPI00207C4BD1|nr:hypothetical protein [Crossiella sp. SN42]MCO1575607.1 hypothetical protein [Crossiella sp. SN42]